VINGNGGRWFGLGTVGERGRVRVLKARECLGATSEKGFEVFESDFGGWHWPSTRHVRYSVKVPSVKRNCYHASCLFFVFIHLS